MQEQERSVWELVVYGHPVETLDDLYAWLNVIRRDDKTKHAALANFYETTRRAIPPTLDEEIRHALGR